MGQDTHAQWNADWTSICTAASHTCTSAGISGELYQWAAAGISYRACVVWVKQMQVDCNGMAGCCSNNPSSWKLWAWTTAMDVAEECWSQVAQWPAAQPVLLKRPSGLVLAHFRTPEKPFPLQERFYLYLAPQALTFLDTLHYADCWWVEKNSSMEEENADFWFAAPRRDGTGTKVGDHEQNLLLKHSTLQYFPSRPEELTLLLLGPRVPVAAVVSINKVSIPG